MAIEITTPSACPAEGNRQAHKRRLPQYQSLRGTLGPECSREEPGGARDPPRGAAAVAGTADYVTNGNDVVVPSVPLECF